MVSVSKNAKFDEFSEKNCPDGRNLFFEKFSYQQILLHDKMSHWRLMSTAAPLPKTEGAASLAPPTITSSNCGGDGPADDHHLDCDGDATADNARHRADRGGSRLVTGVQNRSIQLARIHDATHPHQRSGRTASWIIYDR